MTSFRLIRQYPVLAYGVCSLFLAILAFLLGSLGAGYDDGGVGTVAFLLSVLWNVVAFPFYILSEGLFSLNNGVRMPGHWFVVTAMGFVICILGELVVRFVRQRNSRASSV